MTREHTPASMSPVDVKSCCADLYSSDIARMLVGESFHPGGLELTTRLGELLHLDPSHHVLDVASGLGTSAVHLAVRFGCRVTGIDFSSRNVERAWETAKEAGVAQLVSFQRGDAEVLPFGDASFDAVVCECAYCTFPSKPAAALEMARVIRSGGRVGISDLTRNGELPEELQGILAWIACVGDAGPVDSYLAYLEAAGLRGGVVENHDEALVEMVDGIRLKLMAASLMVQLKQIPWAGGDFNTAKAMALRALIEIRAGNLGYKILVATKP
ncbi:MAG: class I SAM-dependent methyltransferase [Acidimicrobiales bacterium]